MKGGLNFLNRIYLNRTLRFFLVIGIIVLSVLAFFYLYKVTYPFLIGLGIAFLINPLVNLLESLLLLGVELVSDRADQAVDLVDEIRLGFHGNYLPIGAAADI